MDNACHIMTQGCLQVFMPDVRNERSADIADGQGAFTGSEVTEQTADDVMAQPI